MKWLDFVEQVVGAAQAWEHVDPTSISYDEHGLTVLADMDGDGMVDRVSRMDFSGSSCTVDLAEWGIEQGELATGQAPEKGSAGDGRTPQTPGWGVVEWG